MTRDSASLVLSGLFIASLIPQSFAAYQFDAYSWTLYASAQSHGATTVTGDQLDIFVNSTCEASETDHLGWAQMIAPESGRFSMEVEASSHGCPLIGAGTCFEGHVGIAAAQDMCPIVGWKLPQCTDLAEFFTDELGYTEPHRLAAHWTIDVQRGDKLRIHAQATGVSLDCQILARFRNLAFTPALTSSAQQLPVSVGGIVNFDLTAPQTLAGHWYVLLGSLSGSSPATVVGGTAIPLIWDGYTSLTLAGGGGLMLANIGVLSATGEAQAALFVPPAIEVLAGVTLHHAYVVLDGQSALGFVSQAVPLTLIP